VFASGYGSNLEAIYTAISSHTLRGVELVLVISNNSNSRALAFAKERHITAKHISLLKFGNDEEIFQKELLKILADMRIDLIVLAGYMKKMPNGVVEKYLGKIINVHPALLPEFGGSGMYGLNVHQTVLRSGKRISGATVHIVEGEYDSGKIILQEICPVFENDTPEILSDRVKEIEHRILPKAIQIVVDRI
jgi:phosphoribosylglycinamide formyltransferase-1